MKTILKSLLVILLLVGTPVFANATDSVVIHRVQAQPDADGQGYTVQASVSVLDSQRQPIEGLGTQDFSVTEDAEAVTLDEVTLSRDLPISVIVVMDTSGSMSGERLQMARQAVQSFLEKLGDGSQVAVYTFSQQTVPVVDLTADTGQAAETFAGAAISASGGTCLYDALYAAVEQAKPLSQGRRAVVVLSDGRDTISGTDVCSAVTEQDVINKALEGSSPVPVYTIGIGNDVDANSLRRMAQQTSGVYNASTSNADLPGLFDTLQEQLSSEYVLRYTSSSAPGVHSLTIEVGGLVASREVSFPGLPPVLSFAYPTDGQAIASESVQVSLSVIDRGLTFERLTFTINGNPIGVGGAANQLPYEYEIDFSQYAGQELRLGVIAQDESGAELSSREIGLTVLGVGETPAEPAGAQAQATPCPEGQVCLGGFSIGITQLAIIGGVLLVLAGVIVFLVRLSNRKDEAPAPAKLSLFDEEATVDGFALPGQEFGKLTVLASDDAMMVGRDYTLVLSPTTLGRSLSSTIALPKDSTVSRSHAELVHEGGRVLLREILKVSSDGSQTPPTYGTFVNEQRLSGERALQSGDEIRLGKRTRLKFYSGLVPEPAAVSAAIEEESEDVTFDGFSTPDLEPPDDATRDG